MGSGLQSTTRAFTGRDGRCRPCPERVSGLATLTSPGTRLESGLEPLGSLPMNRLQRLNSAPRSWQDVGSTGDARLPLVTPGRARGGVVIERFVVIRSNGVGGIARDARRRVPTASGVRNVTWMHYHFIAVSGPWSLGR